MYAAIFMFKYLLFEFKRVLNLFLQASYVLAQYDYFVCPIEYSEAKEALHNECERAAVFKLAEYALPNTVQQLGALVCVTITNWLS